MHDHINSKLFIFNSQEFEILYSEFIQILTNRAANKRDYIAQAYDIVDKITYTLQQSIGIALDLLGNQNANRKHVGNRFEELIRLLVTEIGISNKKIVLKIPYESEKVYSCETDFVFGPHEKIQSKALIHYF